MRAPSAASDEPMITRAQAAPGRTSASATERAAWSASSEAPPSRTMSEEPVRVVADDPRVQAAEEPEQRERRPRTAAAAALVPSAAKHPERDVDEARGARRRSVGADARDAASATRSRLGRAGALDRRRRCRRRVRGTRRSGRRRAVARRRARRLVRAAAPRKPSRSSRSCRICSHGCSAFFAGEPDDFADVELELDDGFYGDCARALRPCRAARSSPTASSPRSPGRPGAARAAGTFCAATASRRSSRATASSPPAGSAASGRSASSTSGACSRSKMSLSDELRDELAAIAPRGAAAGSPSSRRSSTPPGAWHLRGHGELAVHLDLASAGAARRAFTLLRDLGVRSEIRTYRRRAFDRATRYQLHVERRRPRRATLREAGVLARGGAPLERPPKRVVGRSCCRGAYLRGALLGGGSLSGPRAPHLELRATGLEGAEFLAEVAAARASCSASSSGAPRGRLREGDETIADCSRVAGAGETALGSTSTRSSPPRAPRRTASRTPTRRTSSARAGPRTSSSRRSGRSKRDGALERLPDRSRRSPTCASGTRRSRCASSPRGAARRSRRRRPTTA